MKYILSFLMLLITLASCKKNDYEKIFKDPLIYSATVHELNSVVMGNNFSPIVASRNYLYANVAAYEIIAAGYPEKFQSLSGQLNGLPNIPSPATKKINFEFAALLAFCNLGESVTFPKGSMEVYVDSLKTLAKDHGMPSEVYNNSILFAQNVSSIISDWSKQDKYAETRSMSKYTVDIQKEGRWIPTPPAYAQAMEPNWKQIRPLVMDSATAFEPPPPLPFNIKDTASEYYKQVMMIKNAVDSLTPEQKHIALFWDDNPFKLNVSGHLMFATKKFSPGGHWEGIVGIAAKKANLDFSNTVYAYAITSIAMFDAFIQCWEVKYRYETIRPESVINKYIDETWRPFLETPPFPEYTCGHSTCSSAAAEALTSVFGDNFSYTDTTELEFGIPSRSYKSFRGAAQENNWARFYGGIHFHQSCIVSTEYGRKVGSFVVDNLKMKKG